MNNEDKKFNFDVVLFTLYFGLNYGSILTAYALYKTLEEFGLKPVLFPKPDKLWTDHYADENSIANLFIKDKCNILNDFTSPTPEQLENLNEEISLFIVGSDIVWNYDIVGKYVDYTYFLDFIRNENKKIAYASCSCGKLKHEDEILNKYGQLIHRFNGIAVKEEKEASFLKNAFSIEAEMVLDPVFLCSKQNYLDCASKSAASNVENRESTFIFTSVENCDERKRMFLLRGNNILLKNKCSEMRNFIDINRYPESKELLNLDVAYHIRVDDYLYYIQHSDFVITDNYYAMCMAIVFEKPFVVMVNEDFKEIYRFEAVLNPLGLSERLVILQSDLRKKEYLFRKPVRWEIVNRKLNELKQSSVSWLKHKLDIKEMAQGESI